MPVKISPAEWEVLNVLWDRAPATAAEVFDALPRDKDWHIKTVNTFLARLVEKRVLQVSRHGRSNVYIPRKTREQCVAAESEFFLKRVFRGAFGPMLLHFVEKADLSPIEIRELERLLREKKKK
jgi:BlaI family penicillinase repressor